MNETAVAMHEVDWTQPTAVILGNERDGKQVLCSVDADPARC